MTLPTDRIFPVLPELKSLEESNKYLSDLNVELQDMYQEMTQNVNGTIRNYADVNGSEWIPTLNASITPGTFTYSNQVGWVLRQGIMVEVFFDLAWTANGGSVGAISMDLPYKVIKSAAVPFNGAAYSDTVTFAAGYDHLSTTAIPNTYIARFPISGQGIIADFLQSQPAGRVAGSVRYIGVENE